MMTIHRLSQRRVRHNRSTTWLTVIAIALTACLLTTLFAIVVGGVRAGQATAHQNTGNHHATFGGVTGEQLTVLTRHADVESLLAYEIDAYLEQDKIRASLRTVWHDDGVIYNYAVEQGRMPEAPDDITGPAAFFERLGFEPVIGSTVTLTYRAQGEGPIITSDFVIAGLLESRDISQLGLADTRIVYSALVSQSFADALLSDCDSRDLVAMVRVQDDYRDAEGIREAVAGIASDIGLDAEQVQVNNNYLFWMGGIDPDSLLIAGAIAGLILIFSGLVIYSIYYVSVITNVQELGKLKALGATDRQIRHMLVLEGLQLSAIGIPIGLVAGHGVAYLGIYALYRISQSESMLFTVVASPADISVFSWLTVAIVPVIILITVAIALLRPMHIASKVSPIEAIRYQDDTGTGTRRKGYDSLTVGRLTRANLSRNRRRTAVTLATMAIGCSLFMVVGTLGSSLDPLDYARQQLRKGDFRIDLRYSRGDALYPENNLYNIHLDNPLGEDAVAEILAIPGVTAVERQSYTVATLDHPTFTENSTVVIGSFTRADFANFYAADIEAGSTDYDALVANHGIIYSWHSFFDSSGLTLGDPMTMTIHDGDATRDVTATLMASGNMHLADFAVPVEVFDRWVTDTDATTSLTIYADEAAYSDVKAALTALVDASGLIEMTSLDGELAIGRYSMALTTYAAYGFLMILGVISFMNLINTTITSIVTRRREIGLLQAVGLSDRQLTDMLSREGLFFSAGALLIGSVLGSVLGYLAFLWGRSQHMMALKTYRFPLAELLVMAVFILAGQGLINFFAGRYVRRDTVTERLQH